MLQDIQTTQLPLSDFRCLTPEDLWNLFSRDQGHYHCRTQTVPRVTRSQDMEFNSGDFDRGDFDSTAVGFTRPETFWSRKQNPIYRSWFLNFSLEAPSTTAPSSSWDKQGKRSLRILLPSDIYERTLGTVAQDLSWGEANSADVTLATKAVTQLQAPSYTGRDARNDANKWSKVPFWRLLHDALLSACSVYRVVVTTGFARPNLRRFSRGVQCGWGLKPCLHQIFTLQIWAISIFVHTEYILAEQNWGSLWKTNIYNHDITTKTPDAEVVARRVASGFLLS